MKRDEDETAADSGMACHFINFLPTSSEYEDFDEQFTQSGPCYVNFNTASRYSHDFQRDRSSHHCSLCHGTWPSSDGVVSKYHVCSLCGTSTVHKCVALHIQAVPLPSVRPCQTQQKK